ncbi:MAG TPA: iron-sulfur cluster assembly accessory protein [Chromatiaceae bacterium]|jgi:iron-sulfur cluster assembly protein|nr:iron-sulfur cluster assembly accessory protein [Chromatiaceae bacterium]HIB84871.1 iron-sulfur cluster assembly accessory protein [Chromatiaceae bacterium]HIN81350.1 iron-sulfur cluster assembly accessory protein [Chromatiales bacterium]HIO13644.1 iron-sulfur cluster assembly accessory protein [Chromatiales bacterium]HIO54663.1 iron-sulfur cluster assembly accessory protein [Chromatiales bacterium]
MITATEAAAEQIRQAAEQGDSAGMLLRLAVERKDDGSLNYVMGFDAAAEGDESYESEGIMIICSREQADLLAGTVIDFVEIEPGELHFIFSNPNDPAHTKGS